MTYTAQDFQTLALNAFPELRDDFDEDWDLPHLQMAAFSRVAQKAKDAGDWETYARCVGIADRLFSKADTELRNMLYVSFLEHLEFQGPRGKKAWDILPLRLRDAWEELEQHWEQIMRPKQQ